MLKKCHRCSVEKPLSDFPTRKSKGGRVPLGTCRECRAAYLRAYWQKPEVQQKAKIRAASEPYVASRKSRYADVRSNPALLELSRARARRAYANRDRSRYREARRRYYDDPRVRMLSHARRRTRELGLPACDLRREDIVLPAACPVLGIPLKDYRGSRAAGMDSFSLDRIDPSRGYVRGNVIVVSLRANMIKSCATVDELAKVLKFYSQVVLLETLSRERANSLTESAGDQP